MTQIMNLISWEKSRMSCTIWIFTNYENSSAIISSWISKKWGYFGCSGSGTWNLRSLFAVSTSGRKPRGESHYLSRTLYHPLRYRHCLFLRSVSAPCSFLRFRKYIFLPWSLRLAMMWHCARRLASIQERLFPVYFRYQAPSQTGHKQYWDCSDISCWLSRADWYLLYHPSTHWQDRLSPARRQYLLHNLLLFYANKTSFMY